MKTSKLYFILGLTAGCLSATAEEAVSVDFLDTDNFTDFAETRGIDSNAPARYINELSEFIVSRMDERLPPGFKAQVVITDVDMAGDFEPWRRGGFDDVRIVKDLYPPRINLSFRVVDADGNIVSEGDRKLRDLSFMFAARPYDSDTLRHEKKLLANWIRQEFPADALI